MAREHLRDYDVGDQLANSELLAILSEAGFDRLIDALTNEKNGRGVFTPGGDLSIARLVKRLRLPPERVRQMLRDARSLVEGDTPEERGL